MTTLKPGERVTFRNEAGEWTEGQVWSLHPTEGMCWIVDAQQRQYARKRVDLLTMHTSHTPEMLPLPTPMRPSRARPDTLKLATSNGPR